jgi:hypothetical protein
LFHLLLQHGFDHVELVFFVAEKFGVNFGQFRLWMLLGDDEYFILVLLDLFIEFFLSFFESVFLFEAHCYFLF